jgi:GGDEF domain-containing protein
MPIAAALERARRAIAGAEVDLASPFAAAELRVRRELGLAVPKPESILALWASRQPGSRAGDDRYRWEISHKRHRAAGHVPPQTEWRLFRPDLERDEDKVELAISLPVSLAEHTSLLLELEDRGGDVGARAHAFLGEAEPLVRRDLALLVALASPWIATFALRCLALRPRSLERYGALALALATSYAGIAERDFVAGLRYPFHEKPLASASAHLATGLLHLGVELPVLAALVGHVGATRHPSGAWGDPHGSDKWAAEDLLTTLACAELLVRVDPTFDPAPSLQWMAEQQERSGFFCVHGPELVWLTGEVLGLAERASRPFAERFAFPHVPAVNLDRKTRLPFYAYFDDLSRTFAALPGISATKTEVAFIDLAGFGAFNNACGQDVGDAALGAFAEAISELPGTRAIRDGGDEFLVVGAPTRTGMASDLDALRRAWPARFAKRFPGAPVVAPRIVVAETKSGELRACREALGRKIGEVKARVKEMGPEGVLEG